VAPVPEPELLQGLDQLVSSELLFRRGLPPDATYTFKHALVQDTAYESLLRSRRGGLHARVVQALVERVPDVENTQPGLLGHHCAQAGLIEQAALYYRRAGERSAERAALAETREQLERGLTLISSLPDTSGRRVLEVELKLALGRVLFSMRGNADVDAGKVFEEAVVLSRDLEGVELFIRALWGYWFNKAHRRELLMAENAAQELLSLGEHQRNAPAQIVAHAMLGITRFAQGRFEDARRNLQTPLALCQGGEHDQPDLAIVSNNLDAHATMQLAVTLACLGHVDEAAVHAKAATARVLGLPHLPSRAIILGAHCRHAWFAPDDPSLPATAGPLVPLSPLPRL